MPALPSPGKVIRVELPFTVTGAPSLMSRFFIGYTGSVPTTSDMATFADAVATAWNTYLHTYNDQNYHMGPVQAQDLSSNFGAGATGTTVVAGGDIHGIPSAATCTVINFLIARRYRGGKPKIFLPLGDSTVETDMNTWGATYLTNVATGWGNFITAVKAAAWAGASALQHVNVSWYEGFTAVQNPVTGRYRNVPNLRATPQVDSVTSYRVNPTFGSQRRRNGM